MKVTIIEEPEIEIGYAVRTSNVDDRGMHEIPAFWQRYLQESLNNIPNELKLNPNAELGVCGKILIKSSGDFSYLILPSAEETELENSELVYHTIPAATYAVFTTEPTQRETFSERHSGNLAKVSSRTGSTWVTNMRDTGL